MSAETKITYGFHSTRGQKPLNQDFCDLRIPNAALQMTKGIACALADGISSSPVSQVASQLAVTTFMEDYFATPETWSVGRAAQRVLAATNSWLYAQTLQGPHRFDKDKGYVCTFSALVVRAATLHLFHVGDARIYRLREGELEQLTQDHRLHISSHESYLSRALGMDSQLMIDHTVHTVEPGDLYVLMTDGVYEYLDHMALQQSLERHRDDFDKAAEALCEHALANGSGDNLTAMLVRIDTLGESSVDERYREGIEKPFAAALEPRMEFEGYRIERVLSSTNRSHVYLATDLHSSTPVVLKTLSTEMQTDPVQVERFLSEEWIARRLNSAHLLKAYAQNRPRHSLYTVSEYVRGQTLAQWMTDHPKSGLETVRRFAEQIARGVLAMHRQEMVHRDLRPENILIDETGTLKIIDFGSTRIGGIADIAPGPSAGQMPGSAHYAAPELFAGESGSALSDQYALAAIVYRMLSNRSPYGVKVARITKRAEWKKLQYATLAIEGSGIPVWVDEALRKALNPDPLRRYADVAEFTYDLRHPNRALLKHKKAPLIERDPTRYWQGISLLLALTLMLLAARCWGA